MKKKLLLLLSFCMLFTCLSFQKIKADDTTYSVVNTSTDATLGTYSTYATALSNLNTMKSSNSSISYGIKYGDKLIKCDYGVARFSGYYTCTEVDSNRSTYATGSSATDAAYLSTSSDGTTIRIKLAGQILDVPVSYLSKLEVSSSTSVKSYYTNSGSYMYHYYYSYSSSATNNATVSSIKVGPSYSYFSSGTKYYSYDGHYFYTDYNTMIDDYRNGIYTHAINYGSPYYNYFQYLPQRAACSITASQYDDFVVSKIGSSATSAMYNTGSAFVTAGNTYTVNSLLMFGLACNESGYGRSSNALNNNNLFGHGAYDNSASATSYDTILDCINYHAYNYLSCGYLNAGDYRYRGSHLGDKQSGMNVYYASTPYWGEVAASWGYALGSEYGKYTIGVVNGDVKIYNSPTTGSTCLYSTGATGSNNNVQNVPVLILDKVTGTDGNTFYKIQCDTALNSSRTAISATNVYDASRDYGYILASKVYVINTGSSTSSSDSSTDTSTSTYSTNYNPQGVLDSISSPSSGTIKVSGWAFDKDSSSESIQIKVYIGSTCLGTLTADQTRADVNTAYGITGSHGYSGTLSTSLTGTQTVTIKAVDLGTDNEVTIASKSVTITATTSSSTTTYSTNYKPQGVLDSISSPSSGTIKLSGWAFDKDSSSESIQIKVYIGSTCLGTLTANTSRPDVNTAYGITGSHGYSGTLSTSLTGTQTVIIKAVDLGTGTEYQIASKSVTISAASTSYTTNYNPTGCVDNCYLYASKTIRVTGWAFDKDSPSTSIQIKVYIGSTCLGTLTANETRTDVNNAYGITGSHGFSGNFTTTLTGSQTVTIKAVNVGSGVEYTIGTKTITIS